MHLGVSPARTETFFPAQNTGIRPICFFLGQRPFCFIGLLVAVDSSWIFRKVTIDPFQGNGPFKNMPEKPFLSMKEELPLTQKKNKEEEELPKDPVNSSRERDSVSAHLLCLSLNFYATI